MNIELSKQEREEAIASVQRYFRENMPEEIGQLGAGLLLSYFLEEIGPLVFNRAVEEAQQRLQLRLGDLGSELYLAPMQYWTQANRKRSR